MRGPAGTRRYPLNSCDVDTTDDDSIYTVLVAPPLPHRRQHKSIPVGVNFTTQDRQFLAIYFERNMKKESSQQ